MEWSRRRRDNRRRTFIQTYAFPPSLRAKLREELEDDYQVDVALEGLREWYLACLSAPGETLGMPSRAVDVAWHEMILMTRTYHRFCEQAFGYYLHHSPGATLDEPLDDGLARTLRVVDTDTLPVPLLFAIDSELGLADGYLWRAEEIDRLRSHQLNARAARRYASYSPHGHGCAAGGDGGGGGGGCGGGGCGGGG